MKGLRADGQLNRAREVQRRLQAEDISSSHATHFLTVIHSAGNLLAWSLYPLQLLLRATHHTLVISLRTFGMRIGPLSEMSSTCEVSIPYFAR